MARALTPLMVGGVPVATGGLVPETYVGNGDTHRTPIDQLIKDGLACACKPGDKPCGTCQPDSPSADSGHERPTAAPASAKDGQPPAARPRTRKRSG